MDPDDISKPTAGADFAALFRKDYRNVMYRVMCAGASADEADEATEAAMTEAWNKWMTIISPGAYVRRVALHKFIDERREKERCNLRSAQLGLVVKMIINEYTPKEVAEALGATPQAVRQRLCSARRQLRAALRRWRGEDNRTNDPRKEA